MPFKRALVVDDSKSARIALKVMLERYDLAVDFAKSGEEALEYLKLEPVDVIFMDHTMPGMDGLEAVAAIKDDPRTATIPVMMYTAKAGEVYVSQARALGAVGVIPKEVQPGVLFNMLLELGLVEDRRARVSGDSSESDDSSESRDSSEVADAGKAEGAEEKPTIPLPVAVQVRDTETRTPDSEPSLRSVVTQIMEDQHHVLRSAILRSQRSVAHEVAEEILNRLADGPGEPEAPASSETEKRPASLRTIVTVGALALLVLVLVLGGLYYGAARDRDRALAQLRQFDTRSAEQLTMAETVTTDLLKDMSVERRATLSRHLQGLEWALSEGGHTPLHEPLFNARRAAQLAQLVSHLTEMGFEGTIRLTGHLGEFCLAETDPGGHSLADPSSSVDGCGRIGHPLDESAYVSDHQSLEFADFLNSSALLNARGIRLEVIANDRSGSVRRYPFPSELTTAGEWNRVAELNNRVEVALSLSE